MSRNLNQTNNPFEAPKAKSFRQPHELFDRFAENVAWQDGVYLVLKKGLPGPDICVFSGKPANGNRLQGKIGLIPKANFLQGPFGWILFDRAFIYWFYALIVSRFIQYKYDVGIHQEMRILITKFRRLLIISLIAGILFLTIPLVAVLYIELNNAFGILLTVSLLFASLLFFIAIVKYTEMPKLRLERYDPQFGHYRLSGASIDFLSQLPEYPTIELSNRTNSRRRFI